MLTHKLHNVSSTSTHLLTDNKIYVHIYMHTHTHEFTHIHTQSISATSDQEVRKPM